MKANAREMNTVLQFLIRRQDHLFASQKQWRPEEIKARMDAYARVVNDMTELLADSGWDVGLERLNG